MSIKHNQVTQIAIETAYGDGGSAFTDIPCHVGAFPAFSPEIIQQPVYRAGLARTASPVGIGIYNLPLKLYLKGSGTAGTAPELSKFLRMFGFAETISAGVSVGYKLRDTGHETVGIKHNLDGVQHYLKGVRGAKFKMEIEAGKPILFDGEVAGLYLAPTAVSLPTPSYTDAAQVPPVAKSMALTFKANTYVVQKFTIECDNKIEPTPDLNSANQGVKSVDISDMRDLKGNILIRRDSTSQVLMFTDLVAGTEVALASTGAGSAGNIVGVSGDKLQLTKVTPQEIKGQVYYSCDFQVNIGTTTEFQLLFT